MHPVDQARDEVGRDLRQGGILDQRLQGYEERPAQIQMAEAVAGALVNGEHLLVEASTGTGKALDVDTPIPTPTGWKKMGDLVKGDVVFDEKGHPTRVTATFKILYDRPCYELTFSDGSKLVADAEHQWASYTCVDRRPKKGPLTTKKFVTAELLATIDQMIATCDHQDVTTLSEIIRLLGGHQWSVLQAIRQLKPLYKHGQAAVYAKSILLTIVRERLAKDLVDQRRDRRVYSIVTTEAMVKTLHVGTTPRANHAILVAGALTLPEVDVPIDPYFLGVWLGDGSSRSNQITSADPEIIQEIEKRGYTVRKLSSAPYLYAVDDKDGKAISRWQPGMTGRLRALGLILNKHIPPQYLRASEQQRRELLAGLLDTDGTVSRIGATEFTTTAPQLAQDVFELICSLGFRPHTIQGRAKLYDKDCGAKWTIAFTTDQPMFHLPRKNAMLAGRLRNYTPERNCFRYVVAIHAVPSRPVRCIQVDGPHHLYLVGRSMIPTHNSLAYLLPVVRSDKTVMVATANKALQEQLYHKDIPFIIQHVKPVKAALVKGMSNYLCLARFADERSAQGPIRDQALTRLGHLTERQDFDGDLDVLQFNLPPYLRGKVAADSDDCAWRACPYFEDCYVHKMRDSAQSAQIVVINHTLLLLDVLMDGWLLPDRDAIILDEAHHLEDEATRAFTKTVNPRRVETLLAQKRLKQHCDETKYSEAMSASALCWGTLADLAHFGNGSRAPLVDPFEDGLRLGTAIAEVALSLRANKPEGLEEHDERENQLYNKLVTRANALAADLRLVFGKQDRERFVYYLEREPGKRGRDGMISASAAPLSVTELLKEKLFDKVTVIATSATLAINNSFAFYKKRVGIEAAHELVLPLTFDYERHAVLYVPRMRHEPAFGKENGPYLDELASEMGQLVRAARGRAFLLFTSQRTLQDVLQRLDRDLINEGFMLLVQGGELGRAEMIRRFRESERAVLFGLRSFWEGVDVAGDALSLVAIDKLPFDPPNDPVHEVRVNRMRAAGENWFGDYVLPLAILRLKQGIGRLLRTQDDRGVLAILDTRLLNKAYGRDVVKALPPARRTIKIETVREFFQEQ